MGKIFTANQRKYSTYKNPVMDKLLNTNKTIAAYAKTVEKKREIWNAIKNSDGTANSLRRGFGELAYGASDHLTRGAVGKISGELIKSGPRYLKPHAVTKIEPKVASSDQPPVLPKSSGTGWGSFGIVNKPANVPPHVSKPLPSIIPPKSVPRSNNWEEVNRPQKLKINPSSKINKAGISPSFNIVDKDV